MLPRESSGWRLLAPSILAIFSLLISAGAASLCADSLSAEHPTGHIVSPPSHGHHEVTPGGWEGSPQGLAYSEFNHHLAGLFVLLMGCAELSQSLRLPSLQWARYLLPAAMLSGSLILLIWSDHEAWPIGSLSFVQTFSGHDPEILQHKTYGILLFLVGMVEALRRYGRLSNAPWSAPLPLFAIIGGLMLFGHSHGVHPSAHKIALDHCLMGTMAVTAGSSKLLFERFRSPSHGKLSKGELLWAGLIVLIGIQLLMYSE